MNKKFNIVFLALGAALLVVAVLNIANLTDEHRHEGDGHIHIDPNATMGGGANVSSGSAGPISDKAMPSNHDELMQIQNLKDMLARNPNDLEHLVMLGNMYFDLGKHDLALDPYEKALQLRPDDGNVRVDYAVSLFNTGKNDQATAELQRVIKENPSHQTAYYNLGVIQLHSGQKDKAREYWTKAVAIDGGSALGQKAQQALSNLR